MTSRAFLDGIGELLTTATVGVYDPDRVWTNADTEVPLSVGGLPDEPSTAIAMHSYTVRDDPKLTDSTIAVQFDIRGTTDPFSALDINDALFDALHGQHDTTVGGVPVALVWRVNSVPAGQDKHDRYLQKASFYFAVSWPSTHRED